MNFDISKRPIKLALIGESQLIIFQQDAGQFFPAFGINKNGTFMNLLMVDSNEEGKYRRGKNCVHIMKLFDDVLADRIEASSLKTLLAEKEIVNVPNHSVHSMIAGKNRQSYIVEPGRKNIELGSLDRDFMVLTNFPLSETLDQEYGEVNGFGSERYKKAYETILINKETFNMENGFSLLKETVQKEGEFPTQFSMIFIPEEQVVYFTLNTDFDKIFKFSFIDKQIETSSGFSNSKSCELTKKGILLSELEIW